MWLEKKGTDLDLSAVFGILNNLLTQACYLVPFFAHQSYEFKMGMWEIHALQYDSVIDNSKLF